MHCRQRCERFPAFPVFPTEGLVALRNRTPYRLGLMPSSDSYASFATGIAASMSRAPSPSRPDASSRTGRARCLPRPFGLGSTIHRAATRRSNATDRYYNSSILMSRTAVRDRQFRFRDFLGSVEAHVWRSERAITPFLVLLAMLSTPTRRPDGRQPAQRLHHDPATGSVNPRVTQLQPVKTSVTSY
jgi:hypothetical protein